MTVKKAKSIKSTESVDLDARYRWDYKNHRAVPRPEEHGIGYKIAMGLLIGLAIPAFLTSPYSLYALAHGAVKYYFRRSDFNREVKRLQKRGYVALTKADKGWLVKLLPKGQVYRQRLTIKNMQLPHPQSWDGKWRLFVFDIPEEFRSARNMIRRKLKSMGCYNIQRSVLAYPYDCREELMAVAEHYQVGRFTLFAETSYLDMDQELRNFFGL